MMKKGTQFTFIGTAYEVYNVTSGMFHAVQIDSAGKRRSPNAKTLKNFTVADIELAAKLQSINII